MNIHEQRPSMNVSELSPEQLYRSCDPGLLPFETTADAEDPPRFIGQPRAVEALRFGIGIERDGFNIFALFQGVSDITTSLGG